MKVAFVWSEREKKYTNLILWNEKKLWEKIHIRIRQKKRIHEAIKILKPQSNESLEGKDDPFLLFRFLLLSPPQKKRYFIHA